MSSDKSEMAGIERAADHLVAAFATHDRDVYFASFDPAATFLFHSSSQVFDSRAEYEQEWATWEAEGFHVEGCETQNRSIEMIADDIAVLTHSVRTRLAGVEAVQRERETIVFRRTAGGAWLGIHEHLSPDPTECP